MIPPDGFKIALLNSNDRKGGAGIACLRLHQSLLQAGFKSDMLVQNKTGNDSTVTSLASAWLKGYDSLLRLAVEKLYFLNFEKSAASRFAFSLANTGIRLSHNRIINDAGILHLHWINQGLLSLNGIHRLAGLKKPMVWTLHDMWAFTGGCHHARDCNNYVSECKNCPYLAKPGEKDLSNRIWRKKKKIFQEANITFVTPSKWLQQCAVQSPLTLGKRVLCIPNPIDTSRYNTGDKTPARQVFEIQADKYVLGFAAPDTSAYFKGGTYLVSALHHLAGKFPELKDKMVLLLLGENKSGNTFNLPFPVVETGYISDENTIIQAYRAMDVFALPSLEENLPNTITEAMACGIPTVAFNTGGIPEMIDHQVNGYVAEYKSSEDLANGLYGLMADHDNYIKMSHAAIDKVKENYSYAVIARKYIELYEELVNK